MSEGTPKAPKREMSLKESVEQIMRGRDSVPRHVQIVSHWNRALLDAQRASSPGSDELDR